MKKVDQTIFEQASQSWREAALQLGITVVTPYSLVFEGKSVDCLAFLPDFGKPNGMVIGSLLPPKFGTDPQLIELANKTAMYWSFIDPRGWTTYNEADFKEALEDWGYFGASAKCPSWYQGYKRTNGN